MSWRALVTGSAKKQLKHIPKGDVERIEAAIDEMVEHSPFRGDIVKLGSGDDRWRRRVGSYRILYRLSFNERAIFVYDISRRTSSTY